MALYADDVIAYDVVPPLQYSGKTEYRTDYLQFLSQYADNVKVEVRDLHVGANGDLGRSEERRVGKECRGRRLACHEKEKDRSMYDIRLIAARQNINRGG